MEPETRSTFASARNPLRLRVHTVSVWLMAMLAPPNSLGITGVRVNRSTGASAWPLVMWSAPRGGVIAVWSFVDPDGVQSVFRFFL